MTNVVNSAYVDCPGCGGRVHYTDEQVDKGKVPCPNCKKGIPIKGGA